MGKCDADAVGAFSLMISHETPELPMPPRGLFRKVGGFSYQRYVTRAITVLAV
jgi:hypothetical protein